MTKDERAAILSMSDGETVELSDGRSIHLRVEPDDIDPFYEYECYGRIESAARWYDLNGERVGRPAGFTGNAEKLWLQQNGGCVWWEPPADIKRTDDGFQTLRNVVNDLATFGMMVYVLELDDDTDAYEHPIIKDFTSIGGVEPFPTPEYHSEIISDLLNELEIKQK